MKKIISLFQRNYDTDRLVRDEVVPGAEWVLAGEGVATRKWDGICCAVRGGKLYKRYELKQGRKTPVGFEPAQDPDPVTGAVPGWVPVGDGPEDKYFREALANCAGDVGTMLEREAAAPEGAPSDGTYELCGPKAGGGAHDGANPEHFVRHTLVPHGLHILDDAPRTFQELQHYLACSNIEGIVWHHPDGRMVKIKKRDFGLKR